MGGVLAVNTSMLEPTHLVPLLHAAVYADACGPQGLVKGKGRRALRHHPALHGAGCWQKVLVRNLGVQTALKRMTLWVYMYIYMTLTPYIYIYTPRVATP